MTLGLSEQEALKDWMKWSEALLSVKTSETL